MSEEVVEKKAKKEKKEKKEKKSKLDDDDDIQHKGYYHGRPKNGDSPAPMKIKGGGTYEGKRKDHDAFQNKWDKFNSMDEDELFDGCYETSGSEDDDDDRSPKCKSKHKACSNSRIGKPKEVPRDQTWGFRLKNLGCLLFMFGTGGASTIMTIYAGMMGDGVVEIDHHDPVMVKTVLHGGDPWLIYCIDESTRKYKLPKILSDSGWDLRSSIGMKIATLNCYEPLWHGKSVAKQFRFSERPPYTFAVVNGDKPRSVSINVKNSDALAAKLKSIVPPTVDKIDKIVHWNKCSERNACVVIAHKTATARDEALEIFGALLEKHRSVKVVHINSTFWSLKLGDAIMKTRPQDSKSVDVLCLSHDPYNIDVVKKDAYSGAFLKSLDKTSASSFMTACRMNDGLQTLGVEPKMVVKSQKPKKKPKPAPTPPPPAPKKEKVKENSKKPKSKSTTAPVHTEREDNDEEETVEL